MRNHPFDPIIFNNSKVLILGSFPSLKSFEKNFYYAHPRNQFWSFFRDIFQKRVETTEEKIEFCKEKRIALWDVVKSCDRVNSSDSNLKNLEVNDLDLLLKNYPSIKRVYFTGKKAQSVFESHYKSLDIKRECLPSPSPAYASMKYQEKLAVYKEKFQDL